MKHEREFVAFVPVHIDTPTAIVLRNVLAYLDECGWCRGTATNSDGGVCIEYAFQVVGGGLYSPATRLFQDTINSRNITLWNDFEVRSFAEVRKAILSAIDKANAV